MNIPPLSQLIALLLSHLLPINLPHPLFHASPSLLPYLSKFLLSFFNTLYPSLTLSFSLFPPSFLFPPLSRTLTSAHSSFFYLLFLSSILFSHLTLSYCFNPSIALSLPLVCTSSLLQTLSCFHYLHLSGIFSPVVQSLLLFLYLTISLMNKSITLPCISFMFIKIKLIHYHSCVMFTINSLNTCSD